MKYGATRDNVLALTAITGTGELVRFGAATSKGAAGYDLARLLIGAEGTLAVIVEAVLKLVPLPTHRSSLRALYRDSGAAALAVSRLMAQPVTPSMLEFMDSACIRLARQVGGADLPQAGALLLIEADGGEAELPSAIAALEAAARGNGCLSVEVASDDDARERLWAARKALSPALRTIASGKINEDVVVPVSRIAELVQRVDAIATHSSLQIVCFGHAGNGNLHVNILFDADDPAMKARTSDALSQVFEAALALDGQLSGEHGIGIAKREFMARALTPATLAVMRQIKQMFDPDGIRNPGKLLPDSDAGAAAGVAPG